MKNRYSKNLFLLVFGMFSMTQVRIIGSIGITELFCDFAAPFLLVKNYNELRRDGFLTVVFLSVCAVVGCCLSSWHNDTEFPFFIRGFAVTYSLFALPICFHALLKDNLIGLKWLLMGFCVSMVINVFAFRQAVEVSMLAGGVEDANTTEMIMNGPLFWLTRAGGWLELPITGWYLSTPLAYSIVGALIMPIFTVMTSESGRSAIACAFVSCAIVIVGRKKIVSMKNISRHFWMFFTSVLLLAGLIKGVYTYLGENNLLGEKGMRKYEGQVKGHNNGILSIIMGGRGETFAGLFACLDNPIWGFGPWSHDEKGYMGDFIYRYGNQEDYEKYTKDITRALKYGRKPGMPCHSHIIGFWVRNGILGLPFWLYVGYCMYRHIRWNIAAIPHWYGYFAMTLPINIWHLLFSPYGFRIGDSLFIACLLLANSIRIGTRILPCEMQQDIREKGLL